MVCGSLDNLPTVFAAVDALDVAGTTPLVRDHRDHRLHRSIKKLLEQTAPVEPHDTPDRRGETSSTEPSNNSPPLSVIEAFTEPQLRFRCATVFAPERDLQLPPPGGALSRIWDGVEHEVRILDHGFEYQGHTYISLAAVASGITDGAIVSGVAFFNLRSRGEATTESSSSRPIYPLDRSAERIRADLIRAGYLRGTIKLYIACTQRFANHHMRPLNDMGETEILSYLVHLLDGRKARLNTYRSARSALLAVYRVSLRRPEEVEHIPPRPEDLRRLAAVMCGGREGSNTVGSLSGTSREEARARLLSAEPGDPLCQSVKRIRADLMQAGYRPATARTYARHIQQLGELHARLPEDMGQTELVGYLIYLLDGCSVGLPTYLSARSALLTVYRGTLGRPQEVARITRRPEDLRRLAAELGTGYLAPDTLAPGAQNGRGWVAATVS